MSCFIVIEEYEDAKPVWRATFSTGLEAENYIQATGVKISQSVKARRDYIEQFVDAIEVPDHKGKEWQDFIKPYNFRHYVSQCNFKDYLKSHLRVHYKTELPNYNPPEYVEHRISLIAIEIKDCHC